MARIVPQGRVPFDVLGNLVLNGGGEHLLGSLPQDVCQNIARPD
jgi:hypothetical protein